MTRKKSTTIVLSETVQAIKDEHADLYGLKELISAGLVLFDKLPETEQIKLIKKIIKDEKELLAKKREDKIKPDKMVEIFRKSAQKLITMKSKDFTTIIARLTPDEQLLISQIRDKLGPNSQNKEKEKSG